MTSNFPKVVLGDLIFHQKGFAFKASDYQDDGIPVVRVSNFTDDSISKNDLKFVSLRIADENQKVVLKEDDVIIATVGSWPNNPASVVGKTVRVPGELAGSVMNQNSVILRVKSYSNTDQKYLFFALKTKNFSNYIVSTAQGSASQASITLGDIFAYEIEWPEKDVREIIVNIVEALSTKIRTNTQTNKTLESIAQAIFKNWFVDFEPVKAKMAAKERWYAMQPISESASPVCYADGAALPDLETYTNLAAMCAISGKSETELAQLQQQNPDQYQQLTETAALFPSAMVDSELGEIPEGWEASDFGSVYSCFDRKRIPLSKMEREKKKGTIPYYGATSVMDYVDERIFDGIYLLLGEDGSVLKEDGTPFIQYIWGPSWVNNHAHVLQGKDDISTEQLLLFISTQNISAYVTGAVQLKLNQKNMSGIPFIKAPDQINRNFYSKIKSLFEKKRLISEETMVLAELRNSLLPKLLSGEIDLTEIQSGVA